MYSVRACLWLMSCAKTCNFSAPWMVTRPHFSYHEKREEKLGNRKTWDEKSKGELADIAVTSGF